ncbi:MAG TPA: hypothetical protein PLR64_00605 [Candidatus Dojkabacteria bacterium]|nr:hypothetical protein [Candidatus Dojkabacteria bacterium]
MKKMFVVLMLFMAIFSASAQWWAPSGADKAGYDRDKILEKLTRAVPVPEIKFAQERKMVAWRAMLFDVENKLGYVYVFCAGVGPVGYYTIFGKVASLNSYLMTQQKVYSDGAVVDYYDIDGTAGENISGAFMRTDNGTYVEIPTNGCLGYLYSDKPLPLKVPKMN